MPAGVQPHARPDVEPGGTDLLVRPRLEDPHADGAQGDRGLGARKTLERGSRRRRRLELRRDGQAVPGPDQSRGARQLRARDRRTWFRRSRANNQNSGGGFIFRGASGVQYPRASARRTPSDDIDNIIVSARRTERRSGSGTSAKSSSGEQPRLGKISMSEQRPDGTVDDRDEVVEGIVLSRTGEIDEHGARGGCTRS